ncbi:MAG: hypothetical protein IJU44_06410 [Kiritimatiellae bacterium]|nr:hypothetical protein [Kiritimatiellia bacterium]
MGAQLAAAQPLPLVVLGAAHPVDRGGEGAADQPHRRAAADAGRRRHREGYHARQGEQLTAAGAGDRGGVANAQRGFEARGEPAGERGDLKVVNGLFLFHGGDDSGKRRKGQPQNETLWRKSLGGGVCLRLARGKYGGERK